MDGEHSLEIGSLKHRVTIQKLVMNVNENGFEIEAWEDYKTVWASVSNLSGKEYYQAAAVQAEESVKFIIRYIEELDASMRIKFRDKIYNIKSIDNISYENRYMEIRAMTVDSGD